MSKSHPEFDSLPFKIMTRPSKKQKCLNYLNYCIIVNTVIFLESEFRGDSDMILGMSSGSEQRKNSDDEGNANNSSDMQHDAWRRVGAERPHFSFNGKPGINVDVEDRNNPLKYFRLFITPFISLAMKLTTKLPVYPVDCISWSLYFIT
jgi:hypothetical protein